MKLTKSSLFASLKSDPLLIKNGEITQFKGSGWLLCGSFNPLHEGHRGMVRVVSKRYEEVHFGISIKNCEKGEIDQETIYQRVL